MNYPAHADPTLGTAAVTISPGMPGWPQLLDECPSPPEALHVAGKPLPVTEACIAIVGTRHPTVAGLEVTRALATSLAEAGFVVVSGLATGIDAAAHRAALDSRATTVAVVGAGLDIDYPKRNLALRRQIEACGSVVSEYPPGTPPRPHHFPARNRVIAALSVATIVVEGAIGSGALITARAALDSNRVVFAVPGSIRNPMAAGPNELLKRSEAIPITSPQDVFSELAPSSAWQTELDLTAPSPQALEPEEAALLGALDDVGALPASLAAATDLTTGKVTLTLARLEVRGLVARDGAGYRITEAGSRLRDAPSRTD